MKASRISREINSQSESFELEAHQMKKFGFQINKKKLTQGGWSIGENKIYLEFLIENLDDFKTELMRRKSRVFYRISKLLRKRTPDQCRSHHQKLLNKHKGIMQEVIKELKSKTCDELGMTMGGSKSQKLKNTSPCTIDLANQSKSRDDFISSLVIESQDYYSVELTAQFLQLNIHLDYIKQW